MEDDDHVVLLFFLSLCVFFYLCVGEKQIRLLSLWQSESSKMKEIQCVLRILAVALTRHNCLVLFSRETAFVEVNITTSYSVRWARASVCNQMGMETYLDDVAQRSRLVNHAKGPLKRRHRICISLSNDRVVDLRTEAITKHCQERTRRKTNGNVCICNQLWCRLARPKCQNCWHCTHTHTHTSACKLCLTDLSMRTAGFLKCFSSQEFWFNKVGWSCLQIVSFKPTIWNPSWTSLMFCHAQPNDEARVGVMFVSCQSVAQLLFILFYFIFLSVE